MLGDTDWLCMRVSSDRTMTLKDGSTGYLHRINGETPIRPRSSVNPPKRVEVDAQALIDQWHIETEPSQIRSLAEGIGVSPSSLLELHVVWAQEHQAWAWPMRDGNGKVVGIRLRNQIGDKWAVKGSKQGIFLPWTTPQETAYVVEGPTDTAAGLSLGLFTVGRPSCTGGLYDLKAAFQRLKVGHVVIIADNDQDKVNGGRKWNPGLDGAMTLQRNLCLPCCSLLLPCKDLREFVRSGGTGDIINRLLKSVIWHVQ